MKLLGFVYAVNSIKCNLKFNLIHTIVDPGEEQGPRVRPEGAGQAPEGAEAAHQGRQEGLRSRQTGRGAPLNHLQATPARLAQRYRHVTGWFAYICNRLFYPTHLQPKLPLTLIASNPNYLQP